MNQNFKIDPVLLLLMGGITFFSMIVLFVEWKFNSDGQVFQVFSNLLSGFGGALLMRVKPRTPEEEKPGVTSTVEHTDKTIVSKSPLNVEESK